MSDEHLYIVTYDIADDKRWRAVFKLMHGYGEWMQLSVFQCRLTRGPARGTDEPADERDLQHRRSRAGR